MTPIRHMSGRRRRQVLPLAGLVLGLACWGCAGESPGPPAAVDPGPAPAPSPSRAAADVPQRPMPRVLTPQQQEQLEQSYSQGIEMLRAGRAREAAGHLAIAAGLAPENPLILRALGNAYAYSNDLERAQRVLKASVDLDPDEPGTHYELAQVALAIGDLDTALVESRRTAALDPGNPKAKELLGMVLYRQGQLGEALAVLEPVAGRPDSRPETLYTLALAYQGQERYEEARDALRTVVERQPEHAEAWFNLGKVLAVLGDEAGAEEANAVFMRLSDQPAPPPADDDANLPPGVGPS